MTYPLRQLNAKLQKVVAVASTEVEQDGDLRGQYVFRDEKGAKFMWGPRPERHEFHVVGTLEEADQIMFDYPLCFSKDGTRHRVLVTFAGRSVPDTVGSVASDGQPSRWNASGTGLDDLVLTPSIQLGGGCNWHGFVGSNGIPPGHAG